jgi:hypothetical protein
MFKKIWESLAIIGVVLFWGGVIVSALGGKGPLPESIGGISLGAMIISFIIYLMSDDDKRDREPFPHVPGGPLVIAVAISATIFLASASARAEVDCYWSSVECRKGTECGWDGERYIHRCLPAATIQPASDIAKEVCATQSAASCSMDDPREHRKCLREVREYNAQCAAAKERCANARSSAEYACRYEARGGTYDPKIPESVTTCVRAKEQAVSACTPK